MEIGVDELQVESLKVLPGTQMRAQADVKDIKYSPLPPYEVLKTPSMSPEDLRTAMQLSRTIDLYYNSDSWQKVIRKLVCTYPDFLAAFTRHLREIMVLDSPVSNERRGVVLYEYCLANYTDIVDEVSLAWIEAGLSLKKAPAGNIMKIKNLNSYLTESHLQIKVQYGHAEPAHRYFLFTSEKRLTIFGYDSENHQPAPVFCADLYLTS